jgi:RNA polymerase sigma factor (sigma-70 family)
MPTSGEADVNQSVRRLLREVAPQVLGVLVRRYRDFAACEDAVQEAFIAAASQWPGEGVPENARAWLIQVATRRMTDHVRAEAARRHREALVVSLVPADEQIALAADEAGTGARDDTLELLFLCCHPALSPASAVALTLRAVGGLTTAEIARAFLVPEATMAQRISRAKQTLQASGTGFEMPADEVPARTGSIVHVLYLMFSEGYAASSGQEIVRTDLSGEALRLARLLRRLVPADPEVAGLLALMLLTDARRAARTGPAGEIVPLDEQDRRLWDRAAIAEGIEVVSAALAEGRVGPYQLQAAVAAVHDEAASAADTDWPQIRALYDVLLGLADNPMVALNQAVAVAMVEGPAVGLARLDELARDARIAGHYRLDAARAHLLEWAGDRPRAVAGYRRAASATASLAERNYLLFKAAALEGAA